MSIKNSSDTIGNRTQDLPACSAVPQPTEKYRYRRKRVAVKVSPSKSICSKYISYHPQKNIKGSGSCTTLQKCEVAPINGVTSYRGSR
jgi:hypothetical protein